MQSLREIQAQCVNAFLLGGDESLPMGLRRDIRPAAIQIAVYQNNARVTFTEALLASYPVVEKLVGRDCFSGLAEKYRMDHPSVSGDLLLYGRSFPEFLDTFYGDTEYAYLADVAHLEWACEEVLTEPESKHIGPDRIRSLIADSFTDIRFRVADQARLIQSDFPILDIWRAHQGTVPETIDLGCGPDHIAVMRMGNDAVLKRITASAFDLALTLRRGAALGDAFDTWTARYNGFHFGRALEELLAAGLLSDLSYE